jgi:hypothetical protein
MGYSRGGGSVEGAILIFAHNIKEAKRIAWPVLSQIITDEYTDMAVTYLKDSGYLFDQMPKWSKAKLESNTPHVVDNPPICIDCEMWGCGVLDENGRCEDCAEQVRFDEEFMKKEMAKPDTEKEVDSGK